MVLLQSFGNGGGTQQPPSEPDHFISLTDGDPLDDATDTHRFSEDFDSTCSTPYVSAPSSPGRGPSSTTTSGYFFSAPASPMHFMLSSAPSESAYFSTQPDNTSAFEFEFESRYSPNGSVAVGSMSSADELFLNGQIRPMKLSSHLQRPQILSPLLDLDEEEQEETEKNQRYSDHSMSRGRDLKLRSRSLHRKARSLSPLRNAELQWLQEDNDHKVENRDSNKAKGETETENVSNETTPSCSASSSRSSSSGRNSKKWIFLKDLLYRSKSEGRGNSKEKYFWSSMSFAPSKEKPPPSSASSSTKVEKQKTKQKQSKQVKNGGSGRPANGVAAKRRVPLSAHELHYTANRAQAEEMKKRTYLPYRQGLLGCLGFSSKGYGALNGITRALNPVSSR